mmetsp:Transcript_2725/g.7575  ORF Transcript_2725/g.7575 Transcript_2725/m.7575 type:complete len:204 (-) Transcript_2725:100-711(-)
MNLIGIVLRRHDVVLDLLGQEVVRVREEGREDGAHEFAEDEEVDAEGEDVGAEADEDEVALELDGTPDGEAVRGDLEEVEEDAQADMQALHLLGGFLCVLAGIALPRCELHQLVSQELQEDVQGEERDHDDVDDDDGASHVAAAAAAHLSFLHSWAGAAAATRGSGHYFTIGEFEHCVGWDVGRHLARLSLMGGTWCLLIGME